MLQEFLYLDGLDSLLDSLYQMSARSFTCISDAILQMDCISCVRCVLNNTLGLEFFINSDVCTKKLTMGKILNLHSAKLILTRFIKGFQILFQVTVPFLAYLFRRKSKAILIARLSLLLLSSYKNFNVAHYSKSIIGINTLEYLTRCSSQTRDITMKAKFLVMSAPF